MKTAKKIGSTGLSLMALVAFVGSLDAILHQTQAANMPPMANLPTISAPPAITPSPSPSPTTTSTMPSAMPTSAQQQQVVAPPSASTANTPSMPIMPGGTKIGSDEDADADIKDKDTTAEDKVKSDKKLATLENKVSDSVKDVVKHLGSSAENVTLDDLNSARQAVAKLEALIDIEKHLADLDKIRSDRENIGNEGNKGLAAQIPVSALRPMPLANFPPIPSAPVAPPAPTLMSAASIEVMRISGSDGHFSALLKTPDGQSKPVHIGDHLTDGSSITDITSKGVVLDQNGTKHVIPVKNVDEVFGNTR